MKVFWRNDGTTDHRSQVLPGLVALADQRQRVNSAVIMAQGKSRQVADGHVFYTRHGSAAAKNLTDQN